MVKRVGDSVELDDDEMAELHDVLARIPAAYQRAAELFRETTMDEFAVADAEVGRLLRRWRQLIGESEA